MPVERQITTLKKILCAGKGEPPEFRKDSKAIFHYEVFLPPEQNDKARGEGGEEEETKGERARLRVFPEDRSLYKCIDGTKLGWPHGYGKPLELVFGKQFLLPLFEDCLRTMLVDEIAQFDVFDPSKLHSLPMVAKKLRDIARAERDPEFARHQAEAPQHQCAATVTKLGYPELDALVKSGPRPTRLVVHLLQLLQPEQYSVDNWQMDEGQRSQRIDELKAEGNSLFAEGEFARAADKYREALTLLDQLLLREKPGEPEWAALDQRNVPLFLNLAQCFLNLGRFYDAANCATEALAREADNPKALFRRTRARMGTGDLDQAEQDLNKLAQLSSEQALVERTRAELGELRKQMEREKEQLDRAMFRAIGGK